MTGYVTYCRSVFDFRPDHLMLSLNSIYFEFSSYMNILNFCFNIYIISDQMISLTVTLALTSEGHINKCPTSTFIDGIFKSRTINDEMM